MMLRRILLATGLLAWVPVIVVRHIMHIPMSFVQILPFLLLHVSCMLTLVILRIIRKRNHQID